MSSPEVLHSGDVVCPLPVGSEDNSLNELSSESLSDNIILRGSCLNQNIYSPKRMLFKSLS
jgi:hypothetical protein